MVIPKLAIRTQQDLQDWLPNVRFQIPSSLRSRDYFLFILQLLNEFMKDEQYPQIQLAQEAGMEGGLSGLMINNHYVHPQKLYWYDDESRFNISDWKGLVFRNHEDLTNYTGDIYILADAFQLFLQGKKIKFERYGMNKNREIVLQGLM